MVGDTGTARIIIVDVQAGVVVDDDRWIEGSSRTSFHHIDVAEYQSLERI